MTDMSQEQAEANAELHQKTIEALWKAWKGSATLDDLQVLCYHCGIDYKEIINAHEN